MTFMKPPIRVLLVVVMSIFLAARSASAAKRSATKALSTAAFISQSQQRQQQTHGQMPRTAFVAPTSFSSSTTKRVFEFLSTPLRSTAKEEVDPGAVDGTDLRIVKYPHPSLRAENVEIDIDELKKKDSETAKATATLAKEMFLLMYAAEGVGLAAPQVGVNQRLMVYNASGDKRRWLDEVVLINPQIVDKSDAIAIENEACLSFPDMDGDVSRSKWIKVEAYNTKGKKIKKKYSGWEARIFQHEYDHLDGVVYVDHLNEEDKGRNQPKLDALVEQFGDGAAL